MSVSQSILELFWTITIVIVFDGLFRHLDAGDKGVNKEGWAYIDGHWKDPRLRAAMIWEAEHQE